MFKNLKLMLIVVGLLLTTPAIAGILGGASIVLNDDGSTTIAINADEIIYTGSFPLNRSDVFGIWAKATSVAGTPSLTIELQESYRKPATEGTADTNYVEPDSFSDVMTISDENAHVDVVAPAPMMYGRYKITGGATNPSDTVLTIYNFTQGNI